jgi:hypothetical protein
VLFRLFKKFSVSVGNHYFFPRFFFLVFKKKIKRYVYFNHTCKYDLGYPDQLDTNKLFGIGYLPSHHENSARFGWRYNKEKYAIEIMSYCYDRGERKIDYICDVNLYEYCEYTIETNKDYYEFKITTRKGEQYTKRVQVSPTFKLFGYYLNPYFGGNKPAPNKMWIEIKK